VHLSYKIIVYNSQWGIIRYRKTIIIFEIAVLLISIIWECLCLLLFFSFMAFHNHLYHILCLRMNTRCHNTSVEITLLWYGLVLIFQYGFNKAITVSDRAILKNKNGKLSFFLQFFYFSLGLEEILESMVSKVRLSFKEYYHFNFFSVNAL